jgi:glycerol uptake facilitator protein
MINRRFDPERVTLKKLTRGSNMHNFFIGELLGSMTLIVFGGGAVATAILVKSKGEGGGWICIATGWGFAVMLGVFVAQASGSMQADINPAVTLAKYFLHMYHSWAQVFERMLAELIGCFIGAIIVWLAYLPHWKVTEDQRKKLVVFSTSPEIKQFPSNLLCEIIGTFILVVGLGALYCNQHVPQGIAPYFVGLLVWAIGLSLGGPTGYAINPARDLGPRIAHAILPIAGKGSSEWSYAWVPILGPMIGTILGVLLWAGVFVRF